MGGFFLLVSSVDLGLFVYGNTLHNPVFFHGTVQEIRTALKTFRILREIILLSDI